MRKLAVIFGIVLIAFACGEAQTANDPTYKLGDISVVIPAPQGFENIVDAIPNDHGRFSANEGAGLLAIQVPSDSITRLKATPLMPLEIYTRVVVTPEVKEKKISSDEFAQITDAYKKNFDNIYDVGSNTMTSARNNVRTWMSQVRGRITTVEISKPRMIAFFNESPHVLSTLMLIVLDVEGHKTPMLVSMSMMHINDRLVNVTVYKRQPTEQDVDTLTEFTKTWT
ncbi:MAG TPA: hypothetical protein VGI80_02360, partial [Pyrinomonadaceae bacterium]